MVKSCVFCQEIECPTLSRDAYFVTELKTGYVSFGYNQYYNGYCLFISNVHATELHELENEVKRQFLFEMSLVAETISTTFKPRKLNIELLGNSHAHLHWHIFPRYKDDPYPKIPVWNNESFLTSRARPTKAQLDGMREKLLRELTKILEREGF